MQSMQASQQLSPSHSSPSAVSPMKLAQDALGSDEDEEEVLDEERLEAIKALIFDAYRIQNAQGLMLADFERDLNFVFQDKSEGSNDERSLYNSMLGMQES